MNGVNMMHNKSPLDRYLKKYRLKRKSKNVYHRYHRHPVRKAPSIIGIVLLLAVIVLLPAVIVSVPNTSKESQESKEVNGPINENSEEMELNTVDVDVKRVDSGETEQVPLEEYVTSVVASEMPAEFEKEALKAQAIAARTYVVNHLLHTDDDKDDAISDQTDAQVYLDKDELKRKWGKDFHWKLDKVSEAVAGTENEIITYEEEPITPTFFSMSNGYTEDAEDYWGNELPYLKSVESKWEEDNPKFTEQKIFSAEEIANKIGISLSGNTEVPIEINRTSSNRVSEIQFNEESFSGKDIREKLDLRSNDFTVKQKDNHFIFTTKGFGHGVGMSQYGANGMAEEGKNYKEIIQYYYQGVELQTIKEATPTLVAK